MDKNGTTDRMEGKAIVNSKNIIKLFSGCDIKKNKGSALVITLVLMAILLALGMSILNMITLNIKTVSNQRNDFIQFQNADGGIYAVAGWMYYYKRADVPKETTEDKLKDYSVKVGILKDTVDYPAGFSSAWMGFDARLDSVSGPTEVEAIVFVPVAPAGYGNGG